MDFSGKIILSGSEVPFSPGDEIFGMTLAPYQPARGALAEYAVFDTKTCPAAKKPKEWTFEEAAGVSLVYLTAKACIEQIRRWVEKSSTKRIAILGGSSSVGIYTTLLAKKEGWKVIATSSGKNKEFCLETLGADEHVDYTSQNVRKAVEEFGPDAVVDCVGGTECIGLKTSKRYISIVGDKTGRTMMGGP